MSNIWFTSDHHFYHRKIISYGLRPFSSPDEMHEQMIERYARRVRDSDTVFFLGDFAFCGTGLMRQITERLPGRKILLLGNHDLTPARMHSGGFAEVHNQLSYQLGTMSVILCHFPYIPDDPLEDYDLRCFDRRPKDDGACLIHGHVHHKWKRRGRMINVGVDVWDYAPVHHDELATLFAAAGSTAFEQQVRAGSVALPAV